MTILDITKKDTPELFETLMEYVRDGEYEEIDEEHRKAGSYYVTYLIDTTEDIPEGEPLHGLWMTGTLVGEYDWGVDKDEIDEFYAAEAVTVETVEYRFKTNV